MGKDDGQLGSAKRAYRSASSEGNRQEEARWANVIGDILKNRSEYVESLKWFRKDYDISIKHLPEKQLLPTCQALGEVYLRLEFFQDALIYQKKHLDLARDSSDLVEQQRACTQLGRTHHEMFLRSNDDHYSVRKAKKYFSDAMQLAKTIKENPQSCKFSFFKEFIDAHNNIGMLEMDLDNLEEAEKTLTKGLDICDEEEVCGNNDGRSRLHHNLGNVYMELRDWGNARDNIEKDIVICKKIGHCQGEAKGYINLGELHYRVQKYEDAFLCYKKALDLAKSMEDENALVEQIEQNIKTLKEAEKVIDEMKKEEQKFKKLSRNLVTARGTSYERKCLLQQNASADFIIEKSSIIFAWKKHLEFAKRKKKISKDLCDKEKLSDSFLAIGESYQKLRNFKKALKWYARSWDTYKLIRNLEGQALVKINIGDVLDSDGDWCGALDAFEEGYRIAVEANLQSIQISALENMHYSHMIRFDNVVEARRLQSIIENLNNLKTKELEGKRETQDCCPETDSDGTDCLLNNMPNSSPPAVDSKPNFRNSNPPSDLEEDDVPLTSFFSYAKPISKSKSFTPEKCSTSYAPSMNPSPKNLFHSNSSHEKRATGHKRTRFVLSDDEDDDTHNEENSSIKVDENHEFNFDGDATSSECKSICHEAGMRDPPCKNQDSMLFPSKDDASSGVPAFEDSTSSHKTYSCSIGSQGCKCSKCIACIVLSPNISHDGSNCGQDQSRNHCPVAWNILKPDIDSDQCVTFKIDNDNIQIDMCSHEVGGELSIESLKVDIACLYSLQLCAQKRTNGLVPVVENIRCDGKTLQSEDFVGTLVTQLRKCLVEVLIGGWVVKSLMKLYIDCCEELSEPPNLKLIKQLYMLEVSEDEVIVSNCGLQDISITPLLSAVHLHKTIALLDLSHNLLGNGTMEKLKQVFSSSSQSYGGLTLDLHCNRLGPTVLFQICECSVLFTRLEVLNVSGNRLTDACGSYLSTILKNCKALYSLNVERCSITSITIQKLAASLDPDSMLSQLYIGHNGPIIGIAIMNLLLKLAMLKGFSEISLNGLKLGKPVIENLCHFAKSYCLSGLALGGTNIGTDNGIQLMESLFSSMQDFMKLDLSFCGLTSRYTDKLNADFSSAGSILELDLEGNPILQQGGTAIASILANSQCYIRVLVLTNCGLSLSSLLQIMQALSGNSTLEVLRLAKNATEGSMKNGSSEFSDLTALDVDEPNNCPVQLKLTRKNTSCNQLEVADSEDEMQKDELPDNEAEKAKISVCGTNGGLWKREFFSAILAAQSLKKLDLSENGLSIGCSMLLYRAWSSNSRAGTAQKHVKGEVVHFYLQGSRCCGVEKCCRKD